MKSVFTLKLSLMLLAVIAFPSWGLSGARLINQSASGQTVQFNLGSFDGVKEGDFAVIVKEIRPIDTPDLRLIPVARAKNIKMNPANSVWVLYKVFDPDLLVKGESYLVLSESMLMSGRRNPKFSRISVITEKDKAALAAQNILSEDKDRLAKLKAQYPEIEILHKRETRSNDDGTLVDVGSWNKVKKDKYPTALYRSPHQDDFRRELRLATFEKLVTAYIKKVNDPTFNYDKFYDEQMKTEFANEFRQRSNFSTEYETFLSAEAAKAKSDAKLYRSLLEKGESWSQDFSDEELRAVMNEVTILQEKDRRAFIMARPNKYALFVQFGMAINDEQSKSDPLYRKDQRYSIDVDFEGVPLVQHETLERFTLNATFRINQTGFEIDGKNASLDEQSLTAGINWYPLYVPYAVDSPALFLGMYVRSGWGQVKAPTTNERGKYTILAAPGFRAGIRYNFKNNFGFRASLSMESLSLDRYEFSQYNGTLPEQVSVADGKLNLALAYSF